MKLITVVITAHHAGSAGTASYYARTRSHSPGFLWCNQTLGRDPESFSDYTRLGPNVGNYPVYHAVAEHLDADLIFVTHDDFIIHEDGYDRRLIQAFEDDPKLGLVGVIGSPEFDAMGGRGFFAYSNFQGQDGGSPAEAHGQRFGGFMAAANVDGCAMCFRREALLELPYKPDFPPFHFYDRLFCAQALEAGWRVGLLGIACDHLSGRTSCSWDGWFELAERWCGEHGVYRENTNGWDHQIYLEAEAQFLAEFRDEKHFIPLKVGSDHAVYHTHPRWGKAAA